MCRVRPSLLGLLLVAFAATANGAAYGTGSRPMTLSRQAQVAANDLAKAYAAAAKDLGQNDAVAKARDAARQARRDYQTSYAAAVAAIVPSPELTAARAQVKDLQDRMNAQQDTTDWSVRLSIASDLAAARSQLNKLESDALAGNADLAVAKATVGDAEHAVTDAIAHQQAALQQDPRVVAARQHLTDVRKQLAQRH